MAAANRSSPASSDRARGADRAPAGVPIGAAGVDGAVVDGAGVDGAVVDGVDVAALARAVSACPAVDALAPGPFDEAVTYLPGRRISGVRVRDGSVEVSVRGRWGIPVAALVGQVRAASAPLASGRRVDVLLAELADPPAAEEGGE